MKGKPGRPAKIKEEVIHEEEKQETKREVLKFEEKPAAPVAEKIAESRSSLLQALDPSQKYFETPEGEVIIGDSEKDRIWSRSMNGGRGGWANPKR